MEARRACWLLSYVMESKMMFAIVMDNELRSCRRSCPLRGVAPEDLMRSIPHTVVSNVDCCFGLMFAC